MFTRLTVNNSIIPVILVGPWVNILVRHGYFIIVMIVLVLSLCLLVTKISFRRYIYVDRVGIFLLLTIVYSIGFSLIYHIYFIGDAQQEAGYAVFTRFYGTVFALSIFWFFALLANVNLKEQFFLFAGLFFLISFINIVWGGIVLISDFPRSWELMEHPNYADGSGRPFGLTGNAAVNSTMLAVSYLFLCRESSRTNIKLHWIWFSMLVIGILVQSSGSGVAALAIVTLYYFRELSLKWKIGLVLLAVIIYFISYYLEFQVIYRMSPRYILHNYIVNFNNVVAFNQLDLTFLDIMFGKAVSLGEAVLSTDLGPLFIYNQMGLVFFLAVTFLLFRIAFRLPGVDRYIILIIFITGIHYQAIFFLSSSFIFSMYIVVALTDQGLRQRKNYFLEH